ncbi:MAG: hypothetical protein NTY11_00430, partial [Candidatus Parcubacteria bacterium]|nr:hypothetical protein [Candidatus Parcubacteria bacterium]
MNQGQKLWEQEQKERRRLLFIVLSGLTFGTFLALGVCFETGFLLERRPLVGGILLGIAAVVCTVSIW